LPVYCEIQRGQVEELKIEKVKALKEKNLDMRARNGYGCKDSNLEESYDREQMQTLIPEWTEYELLDSGAGKKLERFGEFTLIRPEAQAKWQTKPPTER